MTVPVGSLHWARAVQKKMKEIMTPSTSGMSAALPADEQDTWGRPKRIEGGQGVKHSTAGGSAIGERRAWLLCGLMFAVAGVFSGCLQFRTAEGFNFLIDGALNALTWWVPALVGWLVVYAVGCRRPAMVLAAVALTLQAAGVSYYIARSAIGEHVPIPSPTDIGRVAFYLLMLAALVVVVRDRLRFATWPVILDSAVGALGAAAVLTVLMEPILIPALSGSPSLLAVLGAAYPFMDLLLVAAVIGIIATDKHSAGEGWGLLVLGLILYSSADVAYPLLEVDGLYVLGTPLDAVWAAGTALIGSWVVFQGRLQKSGDLRRVAIPVQAVPALATISGLGVLILATQQEVLMLAVVLAGLTLALTASPLVFRHKIRLSDANKEARTDELTGLANRRALYADVPRRMAASGDRPSALLLLDLNKFKEVNDGLGHAAGDSLLTQVAARLSGQLRASDLIARVGGDEFVVHVNSCGPEAAQAVAHKLRQALAEPYSLDGIIVRVNASIGISCYPQQGRDLDLLLRKADMAMYAAKATHQGDALYADGASDPLPDEFLSVQALNDALTREQLILHFQPKIDLQTGAVRGVEALVRWEHPTLGLLQPDTFLRRFEETGLMPALTSFVLGKALDQCALWTAQGQPLSVAVNLPASSVMDYCLPGLVAAMTADRGVPPSALVLEITEDVLVTDRARAHTILTSLREMGVRIALDDFGKGYSSLSYLRELPIDELKLDKSFILDMVGDSRTMALVVSTINLAHSLGLEMTAEGVEDADAYRALSDHGCDVAQGFFMSRPVPAAILDTWILRRSPDHPSNSGTLPGFGELEKSDV